MLGHLGELIPAAETIRLLRDELINRQSVRNLTSTIYIHWFTGSSVLFCLTSLKIEYFWILVCGLSKTSKVKTSYWNICWPLFTCTD